MQILEEPGRRALGEALQCERGLLPAAAHRGPPARDAQPAGARRARVIGAEHRVYFRDVYDHLVRLYDITESLRDLVAGILDTYLSVINNRMNEMMKTFTLITTLFMPISFVAGFFGMNFFGPRWPCRPGPGGPPCGPRWARWPSPLP